MRLLLIVWQNKLPANIAIGMLPFQLSELDPPGGLVKCPHESGETWLFPPVVQSPLLQPQVKDGRASNAQVSPWAWSLHPRTRQNLLDWLIGVVALQCGSINCPLLLIRYIFSCVTWAWRRQLPLRPGCSCYGFVFADWWPFCAQFHFAHHFFQVAYIKIYGLSKEQARKNQSAASWRFA